MYESKAKIYRTDLNSNSNNPYRRKKEIFRWLHHQSKAINTDCDEYQEEMMSIRDYVYHTTTQKISRQF